MGIIPLTHSKQGITVDDQVLAKLQTFELPGFIDRNKLLAALAGLSLSSVRTRTPNVLSVGGLGEHLARFASELGAALGLAPRVKHHGGNMTMEDCRGEAPDVALFSLPDECVSRLDLLHATARGMPEGSTIFVANFSEIVRGDFVVPAEVVATVLEDCGFEPLILSYYALYRKPVVPARRPAPPLTFDEQRRCVFIAGHARSGTSAVCHVLNEQPDIRLTYEAHWYHPLHRINPVDQFNFQRRIYQSRTERKSYALPGMMRSDTQVRELFRYHLSACSYFGDKIAVGVREAPWETHPVDAMLKYQMVEFPWANYAVTLRDPSTSIAAQKKIVPDKPSDELIRWWLASAVRLLDLFSVSDRCVVLPFARLSKGDLRPIEALLGRELSQSNFKFAQTSISTRDADASALLAGFPEEQRTTVQRAHSAYDRLMHMIDKETGRLVKDRDRGDFDAVLAEMRDLLVTKNG